MKITGAIFDMDGTLLNSMDYWGIVASEYLASLGIYPKDDTNKRFLETGMRAWYDYCQKNYALSADYDEAKRAIYDFMNQKYTTEIRLKDGAREMLERLSEAGVKMCLATATERPTVALALKHLGIEKYFSKIFTCGEVGAGKREPRIYNIALEYLGTPKDSTYVFEDAYYALKTASENGFHTICVYDKNVSTPKEQMRAMCELYLDEDDKYRFEI